MEHSYESLSLQYHGRSISLPSRLQQPNAMRAEASLSKLRTFKPSSLSNTEPLTGEAIQRGLVGLVELQDCLEELMESPTSQAALVHHPRGIIMEDTLERSMELLDSTGLVRDICLMVKEHVHMLQSALRRKNGDSSILSDIREYFCFRKAVKKEASKILTILKHMDSRPETALALPMDYNGVVVVRVVRESNAIAKCILKSLLLYLSSPTSRTKQGARSLFALFTRLKPVDHGLGDVGCVDFALHEYLRNNENKACLELARTRLQILDSRIEALENGLERLFRGLIRNRVTLLNMFNH